MLSIRCVFHYMLFNFGELGKKNYDQVEYIHFKLVFFSDSEQHFLHYETTQGGILNIVSIKARNF